MSLKLTEKKLIRKNLRFSTFFAKFGRRKVFVKKANTVKLIKRLYREISGMHILAELDPLKKFYDVPKIIQLDNNTLITTWIEGTPLLDYLENHDFFSKYIPKLIRIYGFIDERSPSSKGITILNNPKSKPMIDRLLEKISLTKAATLLNKKKILLIANYAKKHLSSLEAKFAHGDLQPANVLIDKKGNFNIIDCESCSFLWPRHYEIVNFVFNYSYIHPDKAIFLKNCIKDYIKNLQMPKEQILQQLNTIAAIRWLSIIVEQLTNHTEIAHETLAPEKLLQLNHIAENILSEKRYFFE